jgi:hypothetical protein
MKSRHELDQRSKRRRDNYALAKELGFTAKEARLLCKWSQKHIKALSLKGRFFKVHPTKGA